MQGGKYNRRSIRLPGYDYSQAGMYFVTICVKNLECLFGEIVEEEMMLNELGIIVKREWLRTGVIRKEIYLDEFIIMPNYFHFIVFINECGNALTVGANGRSPLRMRPKSISSLMAGYKSAATKQVNLFRNMLGTDLWQRNYYEHIIRNENSLNRIRNYIWNNPGNWPNDIENLAVNKNITES
ncbi:hypothetical protein A3H09_00680 [Candidatus Falkowbacteria bacterium RIFCSPLOWO2_12_FULL_45_13]|uniref:Transposase IS200-like domain-containing protein n=1 Tax=Candidatus Falkowbacteria bacterium RIFCSPLOWO2_12_FULL_45_13 TaxID=1797991 RepID=A0A1F5SVN6_9BACT|nr:MAG: hypothetical protein A3H09_00680 [Candidatus Falkowbacteria bacterium RIFCSPLOWO2_12_FULL_45_13]